MLSVRMSANVLLPVSELSFQTVALQVRNQSHMSEARQMSGASALNDPIKEAMEADICPGLSSCLCLGFASLKQSE